MRYFVFFLIICSCSKNNFRNVEKLESFRLLGVYTANPEVTPGTSVNVQVLVSDIQGSSPVINGTYVACIDPGISRGAPVSCDFDPNRVSGAYNLTFASLLPSPSFRTGLNAATLNLTVPATIHLGRTTREKNNGVGYIVIFKFNVGGKDQVIFKRIIASTRGTLNNPPTGSALFLSGAPLTVPPSEGSDLTATSSAPETYDVVSVEGFTETRIEKYEVAWYTNLGSFNKPKSGIGENVEYKGSSATPSLILAVIRDERGGLDFVKAAFP